MKSHLPLSFLAAFGGIVALTSACDAPPPVEDTRSTLSPLGDKYQKDDDCAAGTLRATQDNRFCGRTAGSQDTLFQCVGRGWVVVENCALGCAQSGWGNDACKKAPPGVDPNPPPETPGCGGVSFNGGFYCGQSGGDGDTLYQCVNGGWVTIDTCPGRCTRMNGGADYCAGVDPAPPPEPPAGGCGGSSYNGSISCGNSGGDKDVLYRCDNGNWVPINSCVEGGCIRNGNGHDTCGDPAPPPEPVDLGCGNGSFNGGLYCGQSGGDSNILYQCQSGTWVPAQDCSFAGPQGGACNPIGNGSDHCYQF